MVADPLGLSKDCDQTKNGGDGEGGRKTSEQEAGGDGKKGTSKDAGGEDDVASRDQSRPTPVVDTNIGKGLSKEEAGKKMNEAVHQAVLDGREAQLRNNERRQNRREIQEERQPLEQRRREVAREHKRAERDRKAAARATMREDTEENRQKVAEADRRVQDADSENKKLEADIERLDQKEEAVGQNEEAHPDRVHEAAYDPETGRVVVVPSGPEHSSDKVVVPEKRGDESTEPGHCGMPRAAGVIKDDPNHKEGSPIYVNKGGEVYDEDGNVSHVTPCKHCNDTVDMNDDIEHVGSYPEGVPKDTPPNTKTVLNA